MPEVDEKVVTTPQPKAESPKENAPAKEHKAKFNKGYKPKFNKAKANNKYRKPKAKELIPEGIAKEQAELAMVVLHNQGIRRHTAKNILTRFEEDGFIPSAKGSFVNFDWTGFKVTDTKNISKEYPYTELVFIEALAKAHGDMSADSKTVIEAFMTANNLEI